MAAINAMRAMKRSLTSQNEVMSENPNDAGASGGRPSSTPKKAPALGSKLSQKFSVKKSNSAYEMHQRWQPTNLDDPSQPSGSPTYAADEEREEEENKEEEGDKDYNSLDRWKYFFGVGQWEPQHIDFEKLAKKAYGDQKTWDQVSHEEQVELIRQTLMPKVTTIDPSCRFIRTWDIVIVVALFYTSLITPYEVGFLETSLNFLFIFNRFVDLVFIQDMVLQFFLKVQVQRSHGTVWIRDRKGIAKNYFKGWFAIDVMSILPFDIFGLVFKDPAVQKMKAIRVVRLLRLLKLARVLRASRIFKRWQDRISISFTSQALLKFVCILMVLAHWMACIWGMVGLLLGENLVCSGPKTYTLNDDIAGGSWVTSKTWEPDSPCVPGDVYLASLHFAIMTITSIGYGDITPTRKEESILCVLCQLGGGLTWAYIIGSVCGIIATANPLQADFEASMDAMNSMLAEQHVSHELRWRLREYLREQRYHKLVMRAKTIGEEFSPVLQGRLVCEMNVGKSLRQVPYLRNASTRFIMGMARGVEPNTYCPKEKVGSPGSLNIVDRGSVARLGKILLSGDYWGEDIVLSSTILIEKEEGICLGFVELFTLFRETLNKVLDEFPEIATYVRSAANIIAVRRAVRLIAAECKEIKAAQERSPSNKDGFLGAMPKPAISLWEHVKTSHTVKGERETVSVLKLISGEETLEQRLSIMASRDSMCCVEELDEELERPVDEAQKKPSISCSEESAEEEKETAPTVDLVAIENTVRALAERFDLVHAHDRNLRMEVMAELRHFREQVSAHSHNNDMVSRV